MRRSKYVGVALIGLLVVAAISVAAGSGRKPAKELGATASLRRLSGSEVMDIINKFPDMVPSYFVEQRNDTGFLKTLFPFSEVTSTLLDRAFPGVRFFKGTDFGRSEGGSPYLMAIAGDKRYVMPGRSNYLLLDGGQKVTDKNITELAKAFVILAVGSEVSFPEINFLDAKRTRHTINTRTYDFTLTAKIGEQVEVWYFSLWQNQFSLVYRSNAKGLILEYQPVMVESLPGRGQLDPTPNMIIGTSPTSGDAYVEFDSAKLAHYYVIVKRNQDSTGKKVVFSLYGFPPDSHNVYVQVRDDIRSTVRYFHRVLMNSGSGSDTWRPRVESTGICRATVGYADTTMENRDTSLFSLLGKQGHFPIFFTGRGRMPRIARVVAAGLPHHVTQRGNNHSDVFFDGDDQRFYLWALAQCHRKCGADIWGYCLMTNHLHSLAVPHESDSLARCFAGANLVYTQRINRKQSRSGRL